MDDATPTTETLKPRTPFREFLIGCPPGNERNIADLAMVWSRSTTGSASYALAAPDIQLHCGEDVCGGMRVFRSTDKGRTFSEANVWVDCFISYVCSNCQTTSKTFALAARWDGQGAVTGSCRKLGEYPAYGPPSPSRLISLIGPDRETFLKGRRCESQGLGIGAYAYYRRVVENQKNRILAEIAKVARNTGAVEAAQKLETAIAETQFRKALADVREAIPAALMIDMHSPLALLHKATSHGLHELNDAECLERASEIRVVLMDLSERLAQALKDDKELKDAVSRLMRRDDRPPSRGVR
ncbi:MAG: hypothetical protein OXH75_08075 [Acidobacteria bacterium]|nr:hypothetical protein [Acidobacteriota bacterium]